MSLDIRTASHDASATDAELLDLAEHAARVAGAHLLEVFAGGRGAAGRVRTKSSATDVVSEADVEAERLIRAALREHRPDDAIVGEEGGEEPGTTGLRWVVDPLDGTVNFLYGIPRWSVSVACEGRVGVVFDPVSDETFRSAPGIGGEPTVNGEPLEGPACDRLALALVATGFSYASETRRDQAEVVASLLPAVRDIRRSASAALDLTWAAAGRVDAYYERGVQEWDVAAGGLICRQAGLTVVELAPRGGLPEGILVAAPAIAAELLAIAG